MKRLLFPLVVLWSAPLCVAEDVTAPVPPASVGSEAAPAEHAFTAAELDFFEKKIRPLLIERCYECHSAEAEDLQGGLRLDSRAGLLRGGDIGPAIVPGQPDHSLLIEAVRYGGENITMPPSGRLPAPEIAALEEWVRIGAPFPSGADSTGEAARAIDFEAGRSFWSFQRVRRHPLPVVSRADWPSGRVDGFVLAELERRGLCPSPPADRRTWLRRVTFDLIGLPPSPEEIDAFEADTAPEADARVVERLLSSPRYGERWARFWLDLARYSDTTDKWLYTLERSYLYRDWVVRALNDDLPYDLFVTRQLAADMLPDAEPADVAALGFLGLSPTYWKELKLAPPVIEQIVAEEWDERIDVVTRGFLGLTVACARCHDHKFDPISTRDYYALAGVFASIRLANRPMIDEQSFAMVEAAQGQVAELEREFNKLQMQSSSSAGTEQKMAELGARMDAIKRSTPNYDMPLAHAVVEAALYVEPDGPHKTRLEYKFGEARDVPIFIRGNPAHRGEVVPRRFLAVLSPGEPQPFTHGSGRLDLANAIFTDGAPLAARVIVNRVWRRHFGRGIVETPSDFGKQGSPPTHPELLDDLAARFIESGWSLKWLHRELVLSATYRQASGHLPQQAQIDPGNRWLWRMNRRRLEIEAWRDAALVVSGTLDSTFGGQSVDLGDPQNRRRTLYGTVNRPDLHDMLRLHDFPDPETHSPAREITTTPLQQLFVLNSPFVQEQAAGLAQRLKVESGAGSAGTRIGRAYRLLYGRKPNENEVVWALDFIGASSDGEAPDEAWRQYVQVLLAGNEFLFVD